MKEKKISSVQGEELETLQEILAKLEKIAKSNSNVLLMSDLSEAIAQFDLTDDDSESIFESFKKANITIENDEILDLCSAPGGKSFTSYLLTNGKAKIIACDIYEQRVNLIKQNAERLGFNIYEDKGERFLMLYKNKCNN